MRTVNLHLASPVRSRWWTKLQSDFVPSLGRFGSNLLLQQLILKLDHGWSRLGMFIVEVLLVYILHGYCHWRLFSCVLLGGAAHPHPLQCIKCRNYHLYCSCHQSLFKCDLVEGSRELFIADDITRLHGYHRQSRLSCSFVGVRRLVYMALVIKVTSAQLCFAGCGSCTSLEIYQVICSSVADDTAISHVSTMEWPFAVSLWHCML